MRTSGRASVHSCKFRSIDLDLNQFPDLLRQDHVYDAPRDAYLQLRFYDVQDAGEDVTSSATQFFRS